MLGLVLMLTSVIVGAEVVLVKRRGILPFIDPVGQVFVLKELVAVDIRGGVIKTTGNMTMSAGDVLVASYIPLITFCFADFVSLVFSLALFKPTVQTLIERIGTTPTIAESTFRRNFGERGASFTLNWDLFAREAIVTLFILFAMILE